MPFDVHAILTQLEATAEVDVPAWLPESWSDPEGFAAALAGVPTARGGLPAKSRPGQHYDFFHDLLVRHAGTDRVALRAWDNLKGWQALGYRALHEQSARRASEWARQGVVPGATVCLVYPPGAELLVSLLAAFNLGACVSLLPPQGSAFMARRLEALKPQHVAAEPHQAPLLGAYEKLLLRGRGEALPAFTSYTYKPDEVVARLFSPLADPPHTPLPLTAADAWHGALRDGLLTFGLGPGEHLAAPGLSVLQHQPALLLAALARGATYLHLELADVEKDASLLQAHPLRALGVTPALRDLLQRRGRPLGNVSLWFRNPEEPLDWQAWGAFVRGCGLSSLPHLNVLVDASAGGSVLFSLRRKGEVHTDVLPAPGLRWTLKDANLSGQDAPGDFGLLTLLPDKGRPPPHAVLSRLKGRYLYVGTREARREGRVYPAAEVKAALADLPFVQGVSVLPVPTGGSLGGYRFLLLVFTGAESPEAVQREASGRRQQLRRRLELLLGAEHLPDRVELFPLYPRRTAEGEVDDAWCQSQYLSGMLHLKLHEPLFQALTTLRGRGLESAARTGDDGGSNAS